MNDDMRKARIGGPESRKDTYFAERCTEHGDSYRIGCVGCYNKLKDEVRAAAALLRVAVDALQRLDDRHEMPWQEYKAKWALPLEGDTGPTCDEIVREALATIYAASPELREATPSEPTA